MKKIILLLVCLFVMPEFAQADAKAVRTKLMSYGAPAFSAIGHRGAPWYAPEETAPSFLLASEMGVDYLEGDLLLSKDGVLVVTHDDDFSRTTNVAKVFPGREKHPVSSFTWAEIQMLDAGSSYNENLTAKGFSKHTPRDFFVGTKILRLEQLMAIARAVPGRNPGIYLEAKARAAFPEEAVQVAVETVDVLKKHGWITGNKDSSRVVFQSFVPAAVKKFKELAPSVLVTYLVGITNTKAKMNEHIKVALQNRADILGPYIPGVLPDKKEKEFIDLIHSANLGVHIWPVDDVIKYGMKIRDGKRWAQSLIAMGVDGIFSDQPDYSVALVYPKRVPNYDHETLVSWKLRRMCEKYNPYLNSAVFMGADVKTYEFAMLLAQMRK